jgi:hypothetical protein
LWSLGVILYGSPYSNDLCEFFEERVHMER